MAARVDSVENDSEIRKDPLHLLSVVIPAYNEEGCIASTVEHLHLELRLQNDPHEIGVVDDESTDATRQKVLGLRKHISELRPVKNQGPPPSSLVGRSCRLPGETGAWGPPNFPSRKWAAAPLPIYLPLYLAGKVFQQRRLQRAAASNGQTVEKEANPFDTTAPVGRLTRSQWTISVIEGSEKQT